MTDLTERLRECPFCGGEAKLVSGTSSTVQCQNDQCIIGDAAPFNDFSHRQDAIAAWNKRPTLETLTQENARLREAGWRDIESAPKDGARFIGLAKDGRATTMSYRSHVRGWKQSENGGWVADGYHLVLCEEDSTSICPRDALHWMPLPPAPARKALGGGDE